MRTILDLFWTFLKMGAVTFGGGYAMLPILQREIVEKRGWAKEEELMDYYAIGQCTPGIIAVNVSTFVGYRKAGIPGGIASTLGFVFPSTIIIMIIAAFISNFADLEIVKNAFAGVRACVCVLILNAVIKLWKSAIVDKYTIIAFAVVLLVSIFTSFPTALIVIIAAGCGIAIKTIRKEASK